MGGQGRKIWGGDGEGKREKISCARRLTIAEKGGGGKSRKSRENRRGRGGKKRKMARPSRNPPAPPFSKTREEIGREIHLREKPGWEEEKKKKGSRAFPAGTNCRKGKEKKKKKKAARTLLHYLAWRENTRETQKAFPNHEKKREKKEKNSTFYNSSPTGTEHIHLPDRRGEKRKREKKKVSMKIYISFTPSLIY